MKAKKILLISSLFFISYFSFSQEDWEPRTHLTGYVNTIAEYSDVKNLKKDYAVGLAELGFLATYQPLEKLEFKATLIYTHYTFHISQLFVEGYGMYHFNDGFKVGAGRFLTPLSPVNLYFYAPLNPSGVVPMLVSHHFMFPQSISGFQFLGEFDASSSLKIGYNATIGVYPYINHFEAGVLGVLSQEDAFPSFGYYDTEADKINNYLCGTGRIYFKINDMLTLGANYFTGDAQQVTKDTLGNWIYYPSTKYTYGFDMHANVSNIKVNAEYWAGQQKTVDPIPGQGDVVNDYKGYYGEVIYDGDKFKPFFRWDYIEDVTVNGMSLPTNAATIGIAYRPIYETLFKLEYKRIMGVEITDIAKKLSQDYNYNYAQFSLVLSF